MSAQVTYPQMDVLNSWKEIAQYLGRGVRTVQRWEATLALPVRRPHGRGRSAVIAMRSDLDRWLKLCPTRNGFENGDGSESKTDLEREEVSRLREKATLELVLQSKQLQADMRANRTELLGTIQRLVQTLGKMATMPARPARMAFETGTLGASMSALSNRAARLAAEDSAGGGRPNEFIN